MAEEIDALGSAKFSSGLWLSDFPAKIRVLTRDPMVAMDKFGNTRYAFAVFNLDTKTVQILNKGPGFPKRFQEINADPDFGGDIRKVNLKVTTNGKQGIEIRYTITPVGEPSDLTKEQGAIIKEQGFDLAEKVKKNAPNALRLSEINEGAKLGEDDLDNTNDETDIIQEVGDEPIDLNNIPF